MFKFKMNEKLKLLKVIVISKAIGNFKYLSKPVNKGNLVYITSQKDKIRQRNHCLIIVNNKNMSGSKG